jgi:hypothetical protein
VRLLVGRSLSDCWRGWRRRLCSLAGLRGQSDLARLGHFDHRTQAARANLDTPHLAVDHQAAALQIEIEPAIGFAVRVADVMPVHGLAAADITTGGHIPHLHRIE